MIIHIRGTHGSGKSTLVRMVIQKFGLHPVENKFAKGKKFYGYDNDVGRRGKPAVAVVGDYSNDCGGCDGIKTQDEVCSRVRNFHHTNDAVLFEGILCSQIWGRYAELARELGHYTFVHLDTPLDLCIARVEERRRRSGNDKPLDPTNVRTKWYDCKRNLEKAIAQGFPYLSLDHKDPLGGLLRLMDVG